VPLGKQEPPPGPGPVVPYNPGYVVDPSAPYGRDPLTGRPLSDKSKIVAGLLQIFLGYLGIGRFYTGHTAIAVAQLALTVVGFATSWLLIGLPMMLAASIWGLVDGIMMLTQPQTDSRGLLLRP
jgi:TM2 domain-containing membrane protein YozV